MAFFLLIAGTLGLAAEKGDSLQQAGQRMVAAVKKRVLLDAVCAISPLVGYMLGLEEKPAEQTKDAGAEDIDRIYSTTGGWSEEIPPGEREIQQELEQLVLAEQSGISASQPEEILDNTPEDMAVGATGDVLQGLPEGASFPEDGEEEHPVEIDADLLAEIDRENQALRDLAFQQAQAVQTQTPSEIAEGQQLTPAYSMEQLADLDFLVHNFYNVHKSTTVDESLLNVEAMSGQDMRLQNPDSGGPKVLIHHTHATEYFADSDPNDPSTLIVGVGDYLEELLETQYGIEVLHDRTVYPYNEAYSQALKNVEQILAENPTIEVFIDLHRDAAGSNKYSVEIDGKEMANIMFFNGLSRNINGPIEYLTNDNLAGNLAFSFQMKMAGDSLYPGLCKRNYLKSYRYNLHVLPRAVIIEVGDNNNTLQEAKNAMEPLARILAYVLNGS